MSSVSSAVLAVDFKGLKDVKDMDGRPFTYRKMTVKDDFQLPWLTQVSAEYNIE